MLRNKSTDRLVCDEVIQAKSFWRQGIGLMFHQKRNLIMHFTKEKTVSLHNFFVFFPLEILILNKDKQVIEINKKFWPFTFFTSKKKGTYCIELATNDSKNQCKVGDFLEF